MSNHHFTGYDPRWPLPAKRRGWWHNIETGRFHWRVIAALVAAYIVTGVVAGIVETNLNTPGDTYTLRQMVEQAVRKQYPQMGDTLQRSMIESAVVIQCGGENHGVGDSFGAVLGSVTKEADTVAANMGCDQ